VTEICGCPATGTDGCRCGTDHPPAVTNPPGLAEIAYRVNDFAGFRRALLTGLPGEQQLTGWSPGPSDLGEQVLDWWAYLADILTFYNERIANNDYLRTAAAQPQSAQSVAGLVRLLGYPTLPAITARGYIAAIHSDSAPKEQLVIPAGLQIASTPTAGSPAQLFETEDDKTFAGPSIVPIDLAPLPALFQPANYAPAGAPPAGPEAGDASVSAGGAGDKDKSVLLAGRVTVKTGASLLLVSRTWAGAAGGWALATVSSARTETEPDGTANTRVVLQSDDWAGTSPQEKKPAEPAAHAAEEQPPAEPAADTAGEQPPAEPAAHAAGEQPPAEPAADTAGEQPPAEPDAGTPPAKPPPEPAADAYRLQKATATALLWSLPAYTPGQSFLARLGGLLLAPIKWLLGLIKALWKWLFPPKPVTPAKPPVTVQMATLVRGIAPGDNVLVTPAKGKPILAQVTDYQEQLQQVVPAPGSTTPALVPRSVLTVRTAEADGKSLDTALSGEAAARTTTVQFGFRDVGVLIPTPRALLDKLGDANLTRVRAGFAVPSAGVVALEDATGAGVLVTAAGEASGPVRLDPAGGTPDTLSRPLQAPVHLLASLVPVSRGTTVSAEILGDGDPTVPGQAFILQQSPLVYLPPATPGGGPPRTTLSVTVDGVTWREAAAFAGQPDNATVYVVRQLANGQTQVRFGDGVNGARLPRGVGNVTASYRYGTPGLPPPPGRLSTVLQPQPNLATVRSPVPLVPGTSPEPVTLTAGNAPPTVVMLGTAAVSPGDCEHVAATVDGVTRVRAYWTWDRDRRSPGITLYIDSADAVPGVLEQLPVATSRIPVAVLAAQPVYLSIVCQLRLVAGAPPADEPTIKDAATAALLDPAAGLFSPQRMAIGQRLYRSQVETALSVHGVRAVLGLRIARIEPAPGGGASRGANARASFDPKADEYFQVRKDDLRIGVVPDG